MRIVLVSAVFPPRLTAEGDHVVHVARDLVAQGHEVHVLTTRGSMEAVDGMTVHPLMRDWSWRDLARITAFLWRLNADVVGLMYLGWLYDAKPMVTMLPWAVKGLRPRTRFVSLLSDEQGAEPARRWQALTSIASRLFPARGPDPEFGVLFAASDAVVLTSEAHSRRFARRFPRSAARLEVINPPPLLRYAEDPAEAARRGRRAAGVEPEAFVFTYFGFMYSGKGVEDLLEAVAHLRNEGRRDVRLLVVGATLDGLDGEWYAEQLRKACVAHGLEDHVVWTGPFDSDSDEGSAYLYASDVAVFPFVYGVALCNTSLATAAGHGLPIVGTRGDDTEDAFVDGVNALLCPPQDPPALATAMAQLIDDPGLRARLVAGSAELTRIYFDPGVHARRMNDLLTAAATR